MPKYPAEDEPDGDIYLPHHAWLGMVLLAGGWFYWGQDPAGGYVALIGLVIVADDVLQHFFGIPTPLDWAFKRALRNDRFRRAWARLVNAYR